MNESASAARLDPRLLRYDHLRQLCPTGEERLDFWIGFVGRVRFKVGTSARDWRVPVVIAPDVRNVILRAVADLGALLAQRARNEASRNRVRGREVTLEVDVQAVREAADRVSVRPRSFAQRTLRPGSPEAQAVRLCLGRDPLLDTGVLDPWFLRGGAGLELVDAFGRLYAQSIERQLRGGGSEPLPYLTQLALLEVLREQKEMLKAATNRMLHWSTLDRTVSTVLAACLRVAAREAIVSLTARGLGSNVEQTDLALSLSAMPLSLMVSARTMNGGVDYGELLRGTNWYGLPPSLATALDRAYQVVGDDAPDVAGTLDALRGFAADDRGLWEQIIDVADMFRLRAGVLDFLREHDNPNDVRLGHLADAAMSHPSFSLLTRDPKVVDAAAEACAGLTRGLDPEARARLDEIQELLVAAHKKKPLKKIPAPSDAQVRAVLGRYLMLRMDIATDHYLGKARARVVDRGAEWDAEELDEHYRAGHVYRFALDGEEIRPPESGEILEAHLFLDMKGYTKRTAVGRNLNVADFMKTHFFVPILERAGKYLTPGDRPALHLNNLLGDAVTLSGDVVSLVYLVDDLDQIFRDYEAQLATRDEARLEHDARQAIEAEFVTLRTLIRRAHHEVEAELAGLQATEDTAEPKIRAAIIELEAQREELGRRMEYLRNYYEARRQQLLGTRIDVGLFVAFGASPAVVRIHDPVYGDHTVAIAEKINESARGTARSGQVRARLDSILEAAQRTTGRELSLPFDVYIDRALGVVLPHDLATAVTDAVSRPATAHDVAARIAERIEAELAGGPQQDAAAVLRPYNDIYNVGRALSKEALEAFLRETTTTRVAFRRRIAAKDLHPDIREEFLLEDAMLELVVSCPLQDRAGQRPFVFHFAGELTFRGFEASHSTAVYEMLRPSGLFFEALAEHHLPEWIAEFQRGEHPALTSL